MVNRGWLPRHQFEQEQQRTKDDKTLEIEAIVRKTEKVRFKEDLFNV
jgi:cytochrome oxidase assembly protein ShyY1